MSPTFLTAKMFGMPRWVWLALLAGGVGFGLYWRNKKQAESDTATDEAGVDPVTGEAIGAQPGTYDPSNDPSMAGLGAYPDTQGGYYPYQSDTGVYALLSSIFGPLTEAEKAEARQLRKQGKQLSELEKLLRKRRRHGGHHPHHGGRHHKPRHHNPQGQQSKRSVGAGRTTANTPTGGGPPARPPYAHLPVVG